MALSAGTRLGSYEILGPIGAGGMGEVYRARDSRLNRDVALKVLPAALDDDPERLARFRREAQTLAALSHPNIATIYGVEESASSASSVIHALVMELVEGEDLAQRLERGAIPVDEAVPIARQIADALDAAHEAGIVHRDLKPANVKIRTDGNVKVLDFGLAKALDPVGSGLNSASNTLANSPTIPSPAMTAMGMILGTAAYMSPEQARGTRVDKRADIWAFGVVLFEMLTGRRLFVGDTVSDTLAEVLKGTIDWTALPSDTPPQARRLLARCLERDPRRRLRDIADARLELDDAIAPSSALQLKGSAQSSSSTPSRWLIACTACVLAGAAGAWYAYRTPAARPSGLRLSITPPFARDHVINIVRISPDGRRVVYWDEASPALLVRDLGEFDSRQIPGSEGGRMPFFSPDGLWVGFYANGKLRKVPVNGGDPVTICDVATQSPGADWSPDGTIYFSPTWTSGLWKVASAGGQPVQVTAPERSRIETAHFWPRVLPDGRHVLFTIFRGEGLSDSRIGLLDVTSGQVATVLAGSAPVYLGNGELAFFHLGGYHVVSFDEATGTATGEPRPLTEQIRPLEPTGSPENYLDAARSGRIVYVPGASRTAPYSRLVWIDRQGHVDPLPFLDYHNDPDLSPDQRHAAIVRSAAGELHIWIYDLERGTRDQLTRDGANIEPRWSPDGTRVAYTSLTRSNVGYDLRWSPADGSSASSVLLATDQDELRWTWLPDGRSGLFERIRPQTGTDIEVGTLGSPSTSRPLIATGVEDMGAEVSPDGRFVAWRSDDTLYAARYPELTARVQLAVGAAVPHWSASGGEIFYVQDGRLVAVPYRVSASGLIAGTSVPLFTIPRGPTPLRYSVAKDGQRFLMLQSDPSRESTEEIRVLDDGVMALRRDARP
jgi:serine/threonine protein kinase/Tol biopolymer transport system component